jgi:hypothetical protein
MNWKAMIYTIITIAVFVLLSCISVGGKPLIAWVLILLAVLFCIGIIVTEIYDFFSGNTGSWLDIDL